MTSLIIIFLTLTVIGIGFLAFTIYYDEKYSQKVNSLDKLSEKLNEKAQHSYSRKRKFILGPCLGPTGMELFFYILAVILIALLIYVVVHSWRVLFI